MNFIDTISLFAIMTALAAIPSTSVGLVVTRSATLGVANGIAVAAGIVMGDLIFVLLAVLGLSVVAETLGGVFHLIRFLGGIYLIWLGIHLFRSANKADIAREQGREAGKLLASYLAGLLLTLGDIKAILFYVSLFPASIDIESLKPTDMGIIVLITIAAVGSVKITYAFMATKIARLPRRQTVVTGMRRIAGGFMIAAGGFMIAKT